MLDPERPAGGSAVLGFRPIIHNWWATDGVAAAESPDDTEIATAGYFVNAYQIMEAVPFSRRNVSWQLDGPNVFHSTRWIDRDGGIT